MRIPLFLLLASGCFPPTLADETEVPVSQYGKVRVQATAAAVQFVVGEDQLSVYMPCPVLSASLAVRFGDAPLSVVSRGGKVGESPGDDVADNDCGAARFALTAAPPDGPARLELTDPTSSLSCSLPDLKAPRQVTSIPANAWSWSVGQAVTLQWSPSTDLTRWSSFSVQLQHLDAGGVVDSTNGPTNLSFDGDLIHFTVPTSTPGAYRLTLAPTQMVACSPHGTASITSTATTFSVSQAFTIKS